MKNTYELPRITPEMAGISSEAILGFVQAVDAWTGGEPHGLMFARHGRVFAECWWSPYTPGRPHIGWSVSKTFTGTAVGIAIREGLLRLDTRLVDLFPECAPAEISDNLSKLTMSAMLSMSCGMADMSPDGPGWLEKFIKTPVESQPGSTFLYNSMGINALGAVIQRVSGQSVHAYLIPRLYEKLGMNLEDIFWTYIPGGYEWCAGGIFCTTEDNLRLSMLYAQDGMWNGERILPEDFVHLATTPRITTDPCRWPFGATDPHPESRAGYGYTLWMGSRYHCYRSFGAHGQYGIVFPEHDLVVSTHMTNIEGEKDILEMLYDQVIPALSAQPLTENPEAQQRLRNYLSTRALPAPVHRPWSPLVPQVSGKCFDVEGNLTLITAFEPREYKGTGIQVTKGISAFTLCFQSRQCVMTFHENEEDYKVHIGLDGGRIENRLETHRLVTRSDGAADEYRHTPTEVLLSGYWETDACFVIKARWIQTSVEKTICFCFTGETVQTDGKLTVGLLGSYPSAPERAVGVLRRQD